MKGLDAVTALRKQGKRPIAVYVQLVPSAAKERHQVVTGIGHQGIVTVQIVPADTLSSIDFRPLRDLFVCIEDYTKDKARMRDLGKRIAEVDPRVLWMAADRGDDLCLYVRTAGEPATTESYDL